MFRPIKTKAEEKFAAAQKKYKQAAKEREKERQKQLEHTANLRALRLAKEAAEREAAADTEQAETKSPPKLPEAQRQES